jgi:hypothetical protein
MQEFDLGVPGAAAGTPEGSSDGNSPVKSQSDGDRRREDMETRPRRIRWAALLQRVFSLNALRCPRCGATLRLVAAIEDPAVAQRILECIGLPARAPPITPATPGDASPDRESEIEDRWNFEQTPSDDEP